MEQQQLRELLETLHQELGQLGSVDEKTETVLATLKGDISKLIEGGNEADDEESVTERLNDAVGHFEEEHPRLSMMIQHVLDSLARMGL
jgi:phage shock protein A